MSVDEDPALQLTMPQMMLISVVLPAPFGPSSAKISPRRISRLTFLTAERPDAYVLDRLATEMIGVIGFASVLEGEAYRNSSAPLPGAAINAWRRH